MIDLGGLSGSSEGLSFVFLKIFYFCLPHPVGGGDMAITNDNYVMGTPVVIFPANEAFTEDLKEIGLQLQPAKSKSASSMRRAELHDSWDRYFVSPSPMALSLMTAEHNTVASLSAMCQ